MHHHHSDRCQHSHSHHHLQPDSGSKQTQLFLALVLVLTFAAAEFMVGRSSHSLALVADSGHVASDGLALGLALLAVWLARASSVISKASRWETGAALVNAIALTAIALWIGVEAITRLQSPPTDIASLPMLITAGVGVGVNGVNIALLHRGSQDDLNLRAAFLHVVADGISCLGVIVSGIAIATWRWLWADGAVSLLVAVLILFSSLPLLLQTIQRMRDER
jgi:cobalt-zinc-cadmium efflux system protein